MSESNIPEISHKAGFRFDKLLKESKKSKEYWEERCSIVELENAELKAKIKQMQQIS